MEQLTLFDLTTVTEAKTSPRLADPYWDELDTPNALTQGNCVGAQVNSDTQKVAPQHDNQIHWVEKYWVERAGNKYWYYRYCWMVGRKKNRRYLGSVTSAIAKNRKLEVENAITDGQSPTEIEQMIRSWRHQKQPHL